MFLDDAIGHAHQPVRAEVRVPRPWRPVALALLVLALGVAITLWWLRPIASGSGYEIGVETTATLLVVWVAWALAPALFTARATLWLVVGAGLVASASRAIGLDSRAEVIRTYESVFAALARGRNPYTCGCIVHVTPAGDRMGDFNYPPAEIWPYQAAHGLVGHWGLAVIVGALIVLDGLAFLILLVGTPQASRRLVLAFMPLLVLWELRTTIAMTMLTTALIVVVVLAAERRERPWHRPVLWVVFGVGLLTKFAVIPLFAVWWWSRAVIRARAAGPPSRLPRPGDLGSVAADLLVPVGIALALCAPYGPVNIVRATLMFNGDLAKRSELTTFYPNAVSGLATWSGLGRLYPIAAAAALGIAILLAPRLPMLVAMLMVTTVFLVVVPTPEPQYLPMVMMLFVGAYIERGRRAPEAAPARLMGRAPAAPRRRATPRVRPPAPPTAGARSATAQSGRRG